MHENERAEILSLNGTWQIEIGGAVGEIRVPGAWEAQGYDGRAGVNEPVIYRCSFVVPAEWAGAEMMLRFGAISYYAEVIVNGVPVGAHEGLWTPFECDVTQAIKIGETNQLEVRVVKPGRAGDRFPYRDVLVGFLPYVFDTFGGIWQDVTLVVHRAGGFSGVAVLPDADSGTVEIRWQPSQDGNVVATITEAGGTTVAQSRISGSKQVTLRVDAPQRWSPETPSLYTLTLQIERGDEVVAETTRRFGFRKLEADGARLRLNGEPSHLRGVLSWGWDPKTLAPMPTDDEVRDEFRRVRAMGFNLVKLCLFVPSENVFRIADEEGMLLWLELPLWLPNLNDHLREQARIEYADIMAWVHHHPSAVIYSLGCELGADMADAALLDALNATVRGMTRDCLVCDNSGSGEAYAGLSFDYADFNDYHFYADLHYFVPLLDLFRRDWRPARPLIFGEFCDADDYRDPAALENGQQAAWRDYEGIEGNVSRWAYIEQEQRMAKNALPFSDAQIASISRRQSLVVRKTILERTRLRNDIGGYVLTGLRDTPISTSGVFDDNGRAKWEPEAFRAFNDDAVLLLEQGRARRWMHGGDRPYPGDLFNHRSGAAASFRVVLAHARREFAAGELVWRLVAPNGDAQGGTITRGKALRVSPVEVARIEFTVPDVARAEQWALEVELDGAVRNRWALWFYPKLPPLETPVYDPAGVLDDLSSLPTADLSRDEAVIAGVFTPELEHYLRAGGRAVLIQPGAGALPTQPVPFWRESIKLLYDHPVMNAMPHAGYADLQFYHVATDHAFDAAAFADMEVTPVMRRLDARLFTLLDYVVDVRLGAGRLLATTLRLLGGAGDQAWGLDGNVAGEYLLHQMIRALASHVN
ncbi:MAG: hypothetical protein IT319_10460 [Anaerolineae bacterium]|nr:hypothetical protein [Anaerolineae bacterium]